MKVEVTDNSRIYIQAKNNAIAAALEAIGLTGELHAKAECPVDTGRLRGSISHMVDEGEQAVYIGTNVEYGKYVELRDSAHHISGKAHFLRDAVTNHGSEYRRIAEAQLKKA